MNGLLNRLADSNLRPLAGELADLAQSAGLQDVLPLVSAGLLQVCPCQYLRVCGKLCA